MPERILFVTGRLAESALRRVLVPLSEKVGFEYEVIVLGISVAALMHVDWILRKLQISEGWNRLILPGWCQGDLHKLELEYHLPVERGPKDLHDLPEHFGKGRHTKDDYGQYDIEILAEINHAPHLSDAELLARCQHYRDSGAEIIDLGMVPGESWSRVGEAVRRLRSEGFRLSIDSFDRVEVEQAVTAGAELVLSCNSSNRDWLSQLPAELIVIPDDPRDLNTLRETVAYLEQTPARYRLDPILEPIGFGFAASLGRYSQVRQEFPQHAMMMGIGNLTELSEVDSSGINLLLAGFCQEQQIGSILTTEVINWCRSAVREFDIARRLAWYSIHKQVLPKHLDPRLVLLRDPRLNEIDQATLSEWAGQLKDANYRIYVERGEIHLFNREGYWHGRDPYALFDQLPPLDASHAFYLGYELSKAMTALTLGKQYRQDEALRWGFLTVEETSAQARRHAEKSKE